MSLLLRSALRYHRQHPLQMVLAMFGIALGVAVVLAVDLANSAAVRSFERSLQQLSGSRDTHRIVARDGQPFAAEVLVALRRAGWRNLYPTVQGSVYQDGQRYNLLGLDLPALGTLRTEGWQADTGAVDWPTLLTQPNAALIPPTLDPDVPLRMGTRSIALKGVGQLNAPTLQTLIIVDLATAQEWLQLGTALHAIEFSPTDQEIAALSYLLPPTLHVVANKDEALAAQQLTASFRLNLTALSLLTLVVGAFLIYNAVTFSVVQRRALLARLRALGLTRFELLRAILLEALLAGVLATLLGLVLGALLAQGLSQLVFRTLDEIYQTPGVATLDIAPWSLLKCSALGLGATLIAALLPAHEATTVAPSLGLGRQQLEQRWRMAHQRLLELGTGLMLAATLALNLPGGLIAAFIAIFALLLGGALCLPPLTALLSRWGASALAQRSGSWTLMALRDSERHLSRTGPAVAALALALAAAVGITTMVQSFRSGVDTWLRDLLNADYYLAPADLQDSGEGDGINKALIAQLRGLDGLDQLSTFRVRRLDVLGQQPLLVASNMAPRARIGYRFVQGQAEAAWHGFDHGEVLITEPLAWRQHLRIGDTVPLDTPNGPVDLRIAGVLHDYASEQGRIFIHRDTYEQHWPDRQYGSVGLYAQPDAALGAALRALLAEQSPETDLQISQRGEILDYSLAVFDRTFAITGILRLLALVIATVGVTSALLAMQLERGREYATLRMLGATPGELARLMSLQSLWLGLLAGLLAIPLGLMLAAALIYVVNRRAFGWSLPFEIDPSLLAQGVGLAMLAALLSALYPALRLVRFTPAEARRHA